MKGGHMLPDSISDDKLKIDCKMEGLQAGSFWCIAYQYRQCRMESGNISKPLILNTKFKNSRKIDHSKIYVG